MVVSIRVSAIIWLGTAFVSHFNFLCVYVSLQLSGHCRCAMCSDINCLALPLRLTIFVWAQSVCSCLGTASAPGIIYLSTHSTS